MKTMKRSEVVVGKGKRIRVNIMVAGESGQGKTTFLKCLLQNYASDAELQNQLMLEKVEKTVRISQIGSFSLEADVGQIGVRLYDTPGYGESLNGIISMP